MNSICKSNQLFFISLIIITLYFLIVSNKHHLNMVSLYQIVNVAKQFNKNIFIYPLKVIKAKHVVIKINGDVTKYISYIFFIYITDIKEITNLINDKPCQHCTSLNIFISKQRSCLFKYSCP